LEEKNDLNGAVQILLSLNFESAQRTYPDVLKMETYLKAAELCIRVDKIEDAEIQVNRASMLQATVTDENLLTRYKSLYAVVLDRNLRFVEAATRYFELSQKLSDPQERMEVLQHAITCTILSPRGQQKNRLLMNLFKDDRAQSLIGYSIVKEMYFERFIKAPQLNQFSTILKPYQTKIEANGMTILQNSIIVENIVSLSRVYKCITFDSLAESLSISPEDAEKTVTRMISANILKGTIDQIDRLITFEGEEMNWTSYIVSVCDQVNKVNELIARKHPELTRTE